MRTIVEAVHAGAPSRQTPGNVAVCLANEGLLENPAGNASLVGHDDDRKPGAIQQSNGIDAVRKEHETIETIEVARLFDERAVTVEKHCWARHEWLAGRRRKPCRDGLEDLVG
jgi:hypothetical protein